jgi:threonine/homoserine/homoserine lactone efflux protein
LTLSLLRFSGLAAITVAGACLVGFLPTREAAGTEGLVAMGVASGIVWLASLVGYLPLDRAASQRAPAAVRAQATLLGLGIRLFVALAGAAYVILGRRLEAPMAFIAWLGIQYLALLALETLTTLRSLRDDGAGGAPSR